MNRSDQEYFDKLYDLVGEERRLIMARLLSGVSNGGKALDVGCGTGAAMQLLAERKWQVWGVEKSRYAIKKSIFQQQITQMDVNKKKLPFEDNFFDLVVVLDVVEHLVNCQLAFSEVVRVLKPGGKVIVTTPIGGSKYWQWFDKWLPHDPTHVNVQPAKFWLDLLKQLGLKIEKSLGIVSFGWPPGYVARQTLKKWHLPVWVGPIYGPVKLGGTLDIWAVKPVS